MARDRWIYQQRDVPEPWAVHLWLFDDFTLDFAIYAEWLPFQAVRVLGKPSSFDAFIDALETTLAKYDVSLDVDDMKMLNREWVRFAIDNDIL